MLGNLRNGLLPGTVHRWDAWVICVLILVPCSRGDRGPSSLFFLSGGGGDYFSKHSFSSLREDRQGGGQTDQFLISRPKNDILTNFVLTTTLDDLDNWDTVFLHPVDILNNFCFLHLAPG